MRLVPVIVAAGAAAVVGVWPSGPRAQAADPTRYVSTSGTDNPTCDRSHPCRTVQHGVDVATPGDTVRIAAGTYVEQVLVSKTVTLVGAGVDKTIIKGPDVKTFDQYNRTYIVEVTSAATLGVTALTVAGPSGPGGALDCAQNPLSLDMGVAAINRSTLTMWSAAVRNIYDIDPQGQETSGCQRGDAISVGKPGGVDVSLAVPASANLSGVLVSVYQKDGVAVRTAGSQLRMVGNRVENRPSSVIAPNGVEVLDGAVADIRFNSVTGNQCNLPAICGPDPFNNTEASGILTFAASPQTVIAGNFVSANDMGVYTDDGIGIHGNQINDNRSVGVYVDTDATKLHVTGNATNRDGYYGIAIGPMFPVDQGGTGKPNVGGNYFIENSATGNQKYDLYQSSDAGPNTNRDNHCDTAYPSKSYWDCEGSESRDDGDSSDPEDHGSPHGDGAAARRPVGSDS